MCSAHRFWHWWEHHRGRKSCSVGLQNIPTILFLFDVYIFCSTPTHKAATPQSCTVAPKQGDVRRACGMWECVLQPRRCECGMVTTEHDAEKCVVIRGSVHMIRKAASPCPCVTQCACSSTVKVKALELVGTLKGAAGRCGGVSNCRAL